MTNLILIIGLLIALAYAIYDQAVMPKLKGETKLAVALQPQAKMDSWILIGLIGLTMAQGVQTGITPFTLFLLGISAILVGYTAFLRQPRLLLKKNGFFFGGFYFHYDNVAEINLAEQQILVIDLKTRRRLLVRIKQSDDVEKVVNFFGGYKA